MGKDYVSKSARRRAQLGEDEQVFLISCAMVGAPLEQPPAHLDWETLSVRLKGDGLAPLAYRRFREEPALLPAHVFATLKQSYYQNASANHIRLQELERLGRLLAPAQISLLVLKGGALASSVYADRSLRFMGDLDIAALPQHAHSVLSLMQKEGYTLHGEISDLDDPALMREKGWHLRLTRRVFGKDIEIEFHWPRRENVLVAQVATLDVRSIWTHAVTLDATNNLQQPAPPDMLLHLCMHTGLQHRFTDLGLRHYIDLDRVIRKASDDAEFWTTFVERTIAANARDVSYFCLQLSHRLLETPIPSEVMAKLSPPSWKLKLFARRIQTNDIINRSDALYDRRRIWWRLLTTDRLFVLAKGPWRTFFPGRTYLTSYYGTHSNWRLGAYTLWHPIHVLNRTVKRRFQEFQRRRMRSEGVSS